MHLVSGSDFLSEQELALTPSTTFSFGQEPALLVSHTRISRSSLPPTLTLLLSGTCAVRFADSFPFRRPLTCYNSQREVDRQPHWNSSPVPST